MISPHNYALRRDAQLWWRINIGWTTSERIPSGLYFCFLRVLTTKNITCLSCNDFKRVEKIYSYICDGKREVLEAWKILEEWRIMDMERALFFLDSDHDRYLTIDTFRSDNIFVTAGYSFENYLVSAEAVNIVLAQYTPFNRTDGRFRRILAEFVVAYDGFVACMRPMMAWCIRVRARGGKPNLSNVDLKKLLKVEPRELLERDGAPFEKLAIRNIQALPWVMAR